MTLKVKTAGAWRNAPVLSSGGVSTVAQPVGVRCSVGGAWKHAERVNVKSGGNWVDSGYVGPPWIPQSPTNNGQGVVNYWDYSTIRFGWWGPAGGPDLHPTIPWNWVLTNEGGGWLLNEDAGTSETRNIAISQDTRYQFYVRSRNRHGDLSTWLGPLKVAIGHPQQTSLVTVNHSEPYHAERSLYLWENQIAALVVPSDTNLSTMSWQMSATNGNWGYCSEPAVAGNNYNWRHQIRPIKADYWDSATGNTTMFIGNPENSSMNLGGQNGAGRNWGFVAVGYQTNRSVGGDYTQFGFMPEAQGYPGCPDSVVGAMSVDGTRFWTTQEYQVTRMEQTNSFW